MKILLILALSAYSQDYVKPDKTVDKLVKPEKITEDPLKPLSETQVKRWKEEGYCLVDGMFTEEEIDSLQKAIIDVTQKNGSKDDFGGLMFPLDAPHLFAKIPLKEKLLRAVKQLFDGEDFQITQADGWSKSTPKEASVDEITSPSSNRNQRMHSDYPNHTHVYPHKKGKTLSVAGIVYCNDSSICGGETALVPKMGEDDPLYQHPLVKMTGVNGHPYINNAGAAEKYLQDSEPDTAKLRESAYKREKYAAFNKGTLLLYNITTLHRGTPIHPGQHREVMNIGYKLKGAPIHSWNPFGQGNYNKTYEEAFQKSSVLQKTTLGLPAPGDDFWEAENLVYTAARWKDADLSPYLLTLKAEERERAIKIMNEEIKKRFQKSKL